MFLPIWQFSLRMTRASLSAHIIFSPVDMRHARVRAAVVVGIVMHRANYFGLPRVNISNSRYWYCAPFCSERRMVQFLVNSAVFKPAYVLGGN